METFEAKVIGKGKKLVEVLLCHIRFTAVQELNHCHKIVTLDSLHKDKAVWVFVSLEKLHEEWQRQKNPVGVSALPTGKFLRVRKVFARIYIVDPKIKSKDCIDVESFLAV